MEEIIDDGSLACLKIDVVSETKQFNCSLTTQQKLVNTTFYVLDIIEDLNTKHGPGRTLVKIKRNLTDLEVDAFKFFTNSCEMKTVLKRIKELNKFPRKVTMRCIDNVFFLE